MLIDLLALNHTARSTRARGRGGRPIGKGNMLKCSDGPIREGPSRRVEVVKKCGVHDQSDEKRSWKF